MPSVYDLKPRFQKLLRPLCANLARAGISANQVTVAALILSVAEGAWIAATHITRGNARCVHHRSSASWMAWARAALIALPAVLFVRMALNAIDGMLAREWNQKTRLGAVLNELGDVVSDVTLYLPFALIAGVDAIAVVIVVIVAVIAEMTGILAVVIGGERRYDGPFGKSDRAALFGVLAVVLAMGIAPGLWLDVVLWIAVAAGALTVVNRARAALKATP